MYKLNKNLASHLLSLEKIDYFLNHGFNAIQCRVGVFGGRNFKVILAGKQYSFKLNSLIQHVYKVAARATDVQKYHLYRIVKSLKALDAVQPSQNSCQKYWTKIRSNWGKKHFDREFYFKQLFNWGNRTGKQAEKVEAEGFRRVENNDPISPKREDFPPLEDDVVESPPPKPIDPPKPPKPPKPIDPPKPYDPPQQFFNPPNQQIFNLPQDLTDADIAREVEEIENRHRENQSQVNNNRIPARPKRSPSPPNFYIPEPSECETIITTRAMRKGIGNTEKIMAIPEEMNIPKSPANLSVIDALINVVNKAVLPTTLLDDGQPVLSWQARDKVVDKLEKLKFNEYKDRYNKEATPELVQGAQNILKLLTPLFNAAAVPPDEKYNKPALNLAKELKKLDEELESRISRFGETFMFLRHAPNVDKIRDLLGTINLPKEIDDAGNKITPQTYINNILQKLDVSGYLSLKHGYTLENTGNMLLEKHTILKKLANELSKLAPKDNTKELITRFNEAFSHCTDRLATGFEDLYFDLINLPKIEQSNTLDKALPLHLYNWRWQAVQGACSDKGDEHQAATVRYVRKKLGEAYGVTSYLSDKGADWEKYAKKESIDTATDIFEQYFNSYEICKNISQLFEDKKELRKEFLDWCQKEKFAEDQVVKDGKVQKGYILFYLLKNQYYIYQNVQTE